MQSCGLFGYIRSRKVHLDRVVDDKVSRTQRVDDVRITTKLVECVTHCCVTITKMLIDGVNWGKKNIYLQNQQQPVHQSDLEARHARAEMAPPLCCVVELSNPKSSPHRLPSRESCHNNEPRIRVEHESRMVAHLGKQPIVTK